MEQHWFEFDPSGQKIGISINGEKPLVITKDDLRISYFSSGHGGQNLNRHMNGVRLIYRIPSAYQYAFRKTKELISKCISERNREQNFKEALKHLAEKVEAYFYLAPHRTITKPPRIEKQKRLKDKKRRSQLKGDRKKIEF